jgi:hypothetical protein
MYFQPVPVGLEPGPNLAVLVVGGVVLNQNGPLCTVAPCQLLQEAEVGGGIEDYALAILKVRAPQFDSTENLHVLALAGNGNFRWPAYAAPGGAERRILPETGFVGEEERPVSRTGFFLSAG